MNILDQIDEVVKGSEDLSDEVIEARAREHGLARVPRNVTEVVDILFGHVKPQGGKPYLEDEALQWSNPAELRERLRFEQLAGASSEVRDFADMNQLKREIGFMQFESTVINAAPATRLRLAFEWRMESHEIIADFERNNRISDRVSIAVTLDVERAYETMITLRPGEELDVPDEIEELGGGLWRFRTPPEPLQQRGQWWAPWRD